MAGASNGYLRALAAAGAPIVGTSGADALTGTSDGDEIRGVRGDDRLLGLGGDDLLLGGAGDDAFLFGSGQDGTFEWVEPLLDDGADVIRGGAGIDTYVVPTFWQTEGPWFWWKVANGVVADLAAGTIDYVDTGFASDRLHSIENIRTTQGNNRVLGTDGANVIECGGGHSVVRGRGGDDVIVGGATSGYAWKTVMERLDGGAGDDVIDSGGSYWEYEEARYFEGGITTDRLLGRGGDDRLIGGKGHVAMTGGRGADLFETRCDVFVEWDYGVSVPSDLVASTATITDFDPVEGDRIELHVVATALDYDDYLNLGPTRGPAPTWVGEIAAVDVGEVGYTTLHRANGSVDTIVTYRFLATWPGYSGEMAEEREFRIVLEDYEGGLTDEWLTIF